MSEAAAKLLADALSLPEEERSEIADKLWESLGPETDQLTDQEWEEEIRRRAEDARSGTGETMSWPEALHYIMDDTEEPDDA